MLKGLSFALRALPLLLLSAPAWAGSALYLDSQSGDYIGQGQQQTFTTGSFSISGGAASAISVSVTPSGQTLSWNLDFAAPSGQSLAVGNYDAAQRYPFQGPLQPGLSITGDGRGCNILSGRFVVRDLETDSKGNVTVFAADFEQHCEGGTPALFGAIRYNSSLPYPVNAPTADAGAKQSVLPGASVQLDGSLSLSGNGSITSYAWTQVSGPGVSLSDASTVQPTFTAPSVNLGGADLVFQLQVENSLSLSSTAQVTVHVANAADPQTLLYISSDAGAPLGGGATDTVNSLQALFTPFNGNFNAVEFTVNEGSLNSWTLEFQPPTGQTLQVGTLYDNVQDLSGNSANGGISLTIGDVTCGNFSGYFTILDLKRDGSGKVSSFAADFAAYCNGSAKATHGAIRYNSTVPLDTPTAVAGPFQYVGEGATVMLTAGGSDAGDGASIGSYQWTQLSGPSVALSDPTISNPTFTSPIVPAGGADLVFQVTITNSDGLTSTATVTVHVANPADPVTELQYQSDTGDDIGGGQTASLGLSDGTFTASIANTSGVRVDFNSNAGPEHSWSLGFFPPQGQTLQAGATYAPAGWNGNQPSGMAGLFAGGGSCGTKAGQFTILDIQKDGSGNITSFAADLIEHCDGQTPAFHGKIRYNSTAPLDIPMAVATANAGILRDAFPGDSVTLDGSSSYAGGSTLTLTAYQWTQLSGPSVTLSDPTATSPAFTAPSVPSGGADLVFQLTVTNSDNMTGNVTVTVHVADPADAVTELYIQSDPGDNAGGGQTTTFDTLANTFSLSNISTDGIAVTVTGEEYWAIDLVAPTGQTLQASKTYDLAQRDPFQSPTLPGLSASGGGCNTVTGRFSILDIQTDNTGKVTSLAADFEQHCEGATPALHGFLRYNSSVPLDAPFADAGPAQIAAQGATVDLSGAASFAGGGSETITSYQWTQVSGPSVTLSDPTAAAPTFVAPNVSAGGADLVFKLVVTNSGNATGSDTVTVHVSNPSDPVTGLYMVSDQGDFIGQGQVTSISTLLATFTPSAISSNGAQVTVNGGSVNNWTLDFVAPKGQMLQVNTYDSAQEYPTQSPTLPGLSIAGDGHGCDTISGRFTVLDIQTDNTGKVTSLAVDFEQHCDGKTPALRGKLRYNSTVPLDTPIADAGLPPQGVTQGDTVNLSASGSDAGFAGGTITSYQWTQLSGPIVVLSDPTGATTSFTSPDVPLGGADLVFQVTVTNSDGLTSTTTITVHVANPADPKSELYMESDAGDFIGAGETTDVRVADAVFTVQASGPAVQVGISGGTSNSWTLEFAPPSGQTLQVGQSYLLAQRYPFQSPTVPGLSVFGDGRGCNTLTGSFTVLDIQSSNGVITRFAADFIQHCEGGASALYGWVRYNSAVPLDDPIAVAGPAQSTFSDLPVTLDGSGSRIGKGGTASYSWSQVVANGDPVVSISALSGAQAIFTAPEVPAGGKSLTFMLTATGPNNETSTSTTQVTVGSETDPKTTLYYESTPGDPAALGNSGLVTSPGNSFGQPSYSAGVLGASISPRTLTTNDGWTLQFVEGGGTPGTGAFKVQAGSTSPYMSATRGDQDCNSSVSGNYIVRDIAMQGPLVTRLAVDFVQYCNGSSEPLRGAYRYNSTLPVLIDAPTAVPGPNRTVTQPSVVTLDGSASYPGWGDITGYQWTQISGPHVQLLGKTSAVASFTLPAGLMSKTGTSFTFQLVVSNSLGLSDTARVSIIGKQQFVSLLSFQSDAGDSIGQGQTASYILQDAALSVQKQQNNSLQVVMASNGHWILDFAAKNKQPLKVGAYSGATLYRKTGTPVPGLSISAGGARCNTVSGDFTVRDIQYQVNTVTSLAVDFDQFCNGSSAGLHGKLRYHSSVP